MVASSDRICEGDRERQEGGVNGERQGYGTKQEGGEMGRDMREGI